MKNKQQGVYPEMKSHRQFLSERPWFLAVLIAGSFAAALCIAGSIIGSASTSSQSFLCSLSGAYKTTSAEDYAATPTQLLAILHYATSRIVPQQSLAEITLSFNVLQELAPCNFLVFGLGHDSLMWTSLNPRGNTLFLEEDPKWVHTILQRAPNLRVNVVNYPTQLQEADALLASYKNEKDCVGPDIRLKGNTKCKLALNMLSEEVHGKEWDIIMIDAPRGYFAEAPGRMGAIFSAAVMARGRTRPGVTHVFLHDVDRKVEKDYANEFLCKKYLVKAEGRLWHFEIPSLANTNEPFTSFC
ncbi:probable methyltransferase At1g27930 [Mercurialis annua]|uniref:probable methyltransferase At1g27930 n=1 Tax=Mercurialis annua TaxID=3986 RepID=UPI00215E4F9F|nr:probable methyltransferase At1g27930 [Mercurialis annua]